MNFFSGSSERLVALRDTIRQTNKKANIYKYSYREREVSERERRASKKRKRRARDRHKKRTRLIYRYIEYKG